MGPPRLRTPHGYVEPLDAEHLRWICDGIIRALWQHEVPDEDIRAVVLPRTVTDRDVEAAERYRTRVRTEQEVAHEQQMLAERAAAEQIPDVWP